ncbi:hypothetical protein OIU78_026779 [Salix suchowensis]|nr:hypothetical protein OIU78_026779 [Salix suchowensis]
MAYFEFLPVNRAAPTLLGQKTDQELVDLVDVKLGEEYELVVTTYAGLYRYRVGDILRVAGFKNKALNSTFAECSYTSLTIRRISHRIYKLCRHIKDTRPLCVILGDLPQWISSYSSFSFLEDCCLASEESLNSVYRQGRVSDKSIGPLEIRITEKGTFDRLMDFALSQGASINQYKAPRCVKYAPIIELLNSRGCVELLQSKMPEMGSWS